MKLELFESARALVKRTLDGASRTGVALVCLAMIGMLAAVDVATGIEMHVYAPYFLPICLAAWYGGRTSWIIVSVLSALAAEWAFHSMGGRYTNSRYMILNTLTELATYVFIGTLTERVRQKDLRDTWSLRHDVLTGLLNRRGFRERLINDVRVVARYQRPLTLAFMDLDNFKTVNDSRGHQAGDEVLELVAQTIREDLRETDAAARIGGDEFAIVLPETDAHGARAMLERIRTALEARMRAIGCDVTASIGALSFRAVPADVETLLAHADQQMYLVKHSGKNRTVVLDLGNTEPS
jgi:diguanylate cyclase (GGDEF)-like protein